MPEVRRRRSSAAAQPRSRAVCARRHPHPQRRVQFGGRSSQPPRFFPRRAPPHLRKDGAAQRARQRHRFRHAERRAVARRRARRSGRPGLHRRAGRRPAARHQRRVLRAHRPRKVHAEKPDFLGEQDPGDRLRRPSRSPTSSLDEAEQSIFAIAEDRVRAGFVSMRDAGARQLRDDRAGARAQAAHHRRAVGLCRSRRADRRVSAGRPRDHRGAAVGGQDGARAERGAARRARRPGAPSACSASKCRRSSCSSEC